LVIRDIFKDFIYLRERAQAGREAGREGEADSPLSWGPYVGLDSGLLGS